MMNKREFVSALTKKLSGYPEKEVEERISFYVEMIEDQMEEGVSEEEAVSKIGSVDAIASQIMEELGHTENTQTETKAETEIPYKIQYKEKSKHGRVMSPWIIVLLILGSPIWFSLAIAAVSVIFSLFVVLWSVIISFWSVFAALLGCALGGVAAGIVLLVVGNGFVGAILIGAALVCAGLSIFAFFGCKYATIGCAWVVKQTVLGIKNGFKKKEEA